MSPEQRLASHQDGGPALANFVRTFELNSNISSHDWHVQPSCQRPNSRDPPERRLFSPVRNESDRPRNLLKLPILLLACQRIGITGFTQVIHSSSTAAAKAAQELARPARLKPCPSQTLPSLIQTESWRATERVSRPCCAADSKRQVRREPIRHGHLSHSRAEDLKIRKDRFRRFLRIPLNPSRTAVPECEPRGRG